MTLDEKVAEAARLGMSYGKYVALKYERNGYKPEPRPEPEKLPDPEVRRCEICGEELPPHVRGGAKTCGPACSYELNKRRSRERYQSTQKFNPDSPEKCEYCGAEFLQNRRGHRFCSERCRVAHKAAVRRGTVQPKTKINRSYGPGKCVICGEQYIKRSARQLTCCDGCRKEYAEKKRKGFALAPSTGQEM